MVRIYRSSGFRLERPFGFQLEKSTLPEDEDYSPLWIVYVYYNADFDSVKNLETAMAAIILVEAAMNVNCPVVFIEE